jgi:hypothetical protein
VVVDDVDRVELAESARDAGGVLEFAEPLASRVAEVVIQRR